MKKNHITLRLVVSCLVMLYWSYGTTGQTTLTQGDIVVLGVNANANCPEFGLPNGEDIVHLAFLVDIETGTSFQVTDQAYFESTNTWGTSEGTAVITYDGPTTIPAGTVVTFRWPDSYEVLSPPAYANASYWDFSPTFIQNGDLEELNIAIAGDQLYILTDDLWSSNNFFVGEVIYGYNNKEEWMAGTPNAQNSDLHPDVDPCYYYNTGGDLEPFSSYTGPTSATTRENWIARIIDYDNWTDWGDCSSYEEPDELLLMVDFELQDEICEDDGSLTLPTYNIDGSWSGTGVSGNQFDPSGLDGDIELTFTPDDNCIPEEVLTIEVFPLPNFTDPGTLISCDEPVDLPPIEADHEYPDQGYYVIESGGDTILWTSSTYPISNTLLIWNGTNFCSEIIEVDVIVNSSPDIDPIDDVESCGPYTLPPLSGTNVTPSNSSYFSMPDRQGTEYSIGDEITESGTYYAVAGTSDCFDEVSFEITIEDIETPEFTLDDEYCEGETPDDLPNTSDNDIDGSWSPGTIETDDVGTSVYTFTPDAGECAEELELSVEINANPDSPNLSVDCSGGVGDAIISVDAPQGSEYEYSLDGGSFQSSNEFTGLANGNYEVVVLNTDTGCESATNSIEVDCGCSDDPEVDLTGSSDSVCGNESLTVFGNTFGGSATEVTITHNGDGTVDPSSASSSPFDFTYTPGAVDAGNVVTVTVTTDNPLGLPCEAATATFEITVHNLPSASASSNSPICENEDINLMGDGGVDYSWEGPFGYTSTDQNPVIEDVGVTQSGWYTMTVTDANGCEGVDSTEVEVNSIPVGSVSNDGPYCEGETIELSASGGDSYSWTGPDGFSSTDQNPGIPNAELGMGGEYEVVITGSNGCAVTATTDVEILEGPDAEASSNSPVCLGDDITLFGDGGGAYSWSGPGGYSSTEQNPVFTSDGSSFGTYTLTVTDSLGCTGEATTQVEQGEQPTFNAFSAECAPDFETYFVNVEVGTDSVAISTGTLVDLGGGDFLIEDVDINDTLIVTIIHPVDGCSVSVTYPPPNCDCPSIDAPDSDGDEEICEGDPLPELSVSSTESDIGFNWYDAQFGGNLVEENSDTYQPTEAGTWYVEAIDTLTACSSGDRTAVELIVHSLPQITISGEECAPDLETYSITVTTEGDVVTASLGTVTNLGAGVFEVEGIPEGEDVLISIEDTDTGCESDSLFAGLDCPCPVVDAPVSGGDVFICQGANPESISATAGGLQIDWYDSAMGGTLLEEDSEDFLPAGPGTYYAEAVDPVNGCSSDDRTPVSLLEDDEPAYTELEVDCEASLESWYVNFESDAMNVEVSSGQLANITGDEFMVSDIDTAVDLEITLWNEVEDCAITVEIETPECDCPQIDPPSTPGDVTICEGEDFVPVEAFSPAGHLIDWYDSPQGGALLLEDSETYLPSDSGTWYAEAIDPVSGCISEERTAVSLIILDAPSLDTIEIDCNPGLGTWFVEIETDADLINTNQGNAVFLGGNTYLIENLTDGNEVIIDVTSNVTGCVNTMTIQSPDCGCDPMDPPVAVGVSDVENCEGDSNPVFQAEVDSGFTINWYNSPINGLLLEEDNEEFEPVPTDPGNYVFYAETFDPATGCVSEERTSFSLVIFTPPSVDGISASCGVGAGTYFVDFTSNSDYSVSATVGIPMDLGGDQWRIDSVPLSEETNIDVTNSGTGCVTSFTPDIPDCTCPDFVAPADTVACEFFVLPPIDGFNLTGDEAYFDQADGQGIMYAAGDTLFESGIYYVFYEDASCFIQDSFELVVDSLNLQMEDGHLIVECDPDSSHLFVVADYTDIINEGTGGDVSWFADPNLQIPIQQNVQTDGAVVYVVVELGQCQSDVIPVELTVGISPGLEDPGPLSACDSIELPPIVSENFFPNEGYYTQPEGQGDTLFAGDFVTESTTLYLFSGDSLCWEEYEVQILIDSQPVLDSIPDILSCAPVILGDIVGQNLHPDSTLYYDSIGATGNQFLPGDTLLESVTLYAWSGTAGCFDEVVFEVVISDPPAIDSFDSPLTACEWAVLPQIEGENLSSNPLWFTEAGGGGDTLMVGDTIFEGGIFYARDSLPNSDSFCVSEMPLEIIIDDLPDVVISAPDTVCAGESIELMASGGDEYFWTGPAGFTDTIANPVLDSVVTDQSGVYFVEVTGPNGCVAIDSAVVVVEALPFVQVFSAVCGPDNTDYTVEFNSDAQLNEISVSAGVLAEIQPGEYEVSEVPEGETLQINVSFEASDCEQILEIDSPNCDCDFIDAPVTGDDQEICEGDDIPVLTATADGDLVVNWYDAAVGGNLLAQATDEFLPTETGTFYAEAEDTLTNCVSETRSPISLTINPVPVIEIVGVFCDNAFGTLAFTFTSDADTINPISGGGNSIYDFDSNDTLGHVADSITETVILAGVFAGTGCSTLIEVDSSLCVDCPDIAAPVSAGDTVICEGDDLPPLTVEVEPGLQVNWYDSAEGGSLLVENNPVFEPTEAGTWYAEAYDPVSDCSSERTAVTLTINEAPGAEILVTDCEDDPDFWFVTFTVDTLAFWLIDVGEATTNPDGSITTGDIPLTTPELQLTVFDAEGCSNVFIIEAPDCDCPEVDPPVSAGDITECDPVDEVPDLVVEVPDGIIVNWFGSATGGDTLLTNSASFSAPEPGTYYAEAVDTATGCVSEVRTPVELTASLPEILSYEKECGEDGQFYSFTFETDGNFFIFSMGDTIQNPDGSFTIENIPIDHELVMVILDTNDLCEQMFQFDPPVCECPEIDPPVSPGDTVICQGDPMPELTVAVDSGFTANWYDSEVSQQPLAEDTLIFVPTLPGIYYVETFDPATGCVSEERTSIEVSENPRPRLPLLQPGCISEDFYFVLIRTNADQVLVNAGEVIPGGGDTVLISDIPIEEDVTMTLIIEETGCTREFTVEAPDCSCPFIAAPVSAGDLEYCEGEAIPEMVVTVDAGLIVDWYDQPENGNLIVGNSPNFTPSSPGTYYAEAVDPQTGCTSEERTPVVVEELPLPGFELVLVECLDEEFYEVVFVTNADEVEVNVGVIEQMEGDSFMVHSIPGGTDLELEMILGPCSLIEEIAGPDCACPPVDLPADSVGIQFCEGDEIPSTDLTLGENEILEWYSSPEGGELLTESDGVFTPPNPGIFYGEVLDTISGCRSETRLVLSVEMLPFPSVEIVDWDCDSDQGIAAWLVFQNADEVDVQGADFEILPGDSIRVFNVILGGEFEVALSNGPCDTTIVFTEDVCVDCQPEAVFNVVNPPCPEVVNGVIEITEVTNLEFPIELSIDGDFVDFIEEVPYQLTQLPVGSYNIGLESGDCELMQVVVLAAEESTAEIVAEPAEIVRGSEVTLTVNTNVDPFRVDWLPEDLTDCEDCTEIEFEITGATDVMVTVTDSLGCSASATISLIPIQLRGIYFPNAFSPNEDGVNDVFRPYFPADFEGEILRFEIYDRWGNRVFAAFNREVTDPDSVPAWDGNFNGSEMNPAVFAYYMEIQHEDGFVEVLQGDVVLLR
ncbi:MAG: gliding motility-associated C-terminal domain-containing protein [Saprospirales bacterium]|nr:MAG: gliding motility-associated C-terminal domain-containing protein [Saprospirales bacterium]